MDLDFEKEIQKITNQIIEKYKPQKIILFGGAVNGEWTPDSDADFLIIKSDTPYYGADRIRKLSRLIKRTIPVDFLIYRPEEFEKKISQGRSFSKVDLKRRKNFIWWTLKSSTSG